MPSVADIIAQRVAQNQQDLATAQQQASRNRLAAGITDAADQGGSLMIGRPEAYQKPTELYKQAEQPIADVQAQQAVQGQVDKDAGAEQRLGQGEEEFGWQQAAHDVNSPESQRLTKLTGQVLPVTAGTPFAAADLPTVAKMGEVAEQIKARLQASRDRAGDRATAKDAKAKEDEYRHFNDTQRMLEGMRGGDPAAKQAETDLYNASKVQELYHNALLNPGMMHLLAGEVVKMGTGQAPTIEAMQHISPKTFSGDLASMAERFFNKPTDSNQKAFAKQFSDYANGISKVAQHKIIDRYGRALSVREADISPEHYGELDKKYVHRFDAPSEEPQTSPAPAGNHPQDAEAVEWAKANPTDKRSAKILEINGVH